MGSFFNNKNKTSGGGGGSANKKNKGGPKGKKARAKAKLDRQWGETVVDIDDVDDHDKKTNKNVRMGKSRLKASRGASTTQWQQQQQQPQPSREMVQKHAISSKPGTDQTPKNEHQQQRQQQKQHRNYRHDDDDDSSSSSSMSDSSQEVQEYKEGDDDMEIATTTTTANPLNELLTMIRKSKKKRRANKNNNNKDSKKADIAQVNENNSDDDEDDHMKQRFVNGGGHEHDGSSDHDSTSSNSDHDSEDALEDDNSSLDEDDEMPDIIDDPDGNHDSSNRMDFFRQRFSRPPLNELEMSAGKSACPAKKIPIESTNVELQVSIPHGCTTDMEELLSMKTNMEWQKVAAETFSSTNQVILQRQWKRLQRKKKKQTPQDGNDKDFMCTVQAPVYSFLARYSDALITTCDSSTGMKNERRARKQQRQMHQMYLLHILNHVLTSRSRMSRTNKLLKDAEAKQHEFDKDQGDDAMEKMDQYRDQGFTRPTVLVLLPTRGTCYQFVKDLHRILGCEMDREQEERFETDYGMVVNENMDGEEVKGSDSGKEQRRKEVLQQKGKEWNELFGENANQDDDFKIGISLLLKTPKKKQVTSSNVSVRLYADFFKSDIIIASPLGLKMLITPENADSEGNSDYLSSIEICLLQHSDVMLMQNWDHVNDILGLLNLQPKNNNDTDFSRVRNYLLEGQGVYWRQLIVSTKFMDPMLVSSFKRFGKSVAGSVKVRRKTLSDAASISSVLLPIKQVFQKIPVTTFMKQSQARVDYFIKNLLPQIQRQNQKHTMVYIPSYFDFCSIRNAFLKREDVVFVSVTEYSRTSEISRGRARFLQGRKPILLYTGRANFFYRHAIRGTQHLIFLGLPEHAEFYADHVNLIGSLGAATRRTVDDDESYMVDAKATSCVVLFTKYEAHALERIVGSSNCSRMLSSSKATFMFHS